jgi:hypothetical protein
MRAAGRKAGVTHISGVMPAVLTWAAERAFSGGCDDTHDTLKAHHIGSVVPHFRHESECVLRFNRIDQVQRA